MPSVLFEALSAVPLAVIGDGYLDDGLGGLAAELPGKRGQGLLLMSKLGTFSFTNVLGVAISGHVPTSFLA
jgi:hypothetical protein